MKKSFLSLTFLAALSFAGMAQETSGKVSTMRIYRMETATTETKTELTVEQEIQQCKDHLKALDEKEAWIRSNPEELKKAEETGWFTDAEATRARLNARIKELENK